MSRFRIHDARSAPSQGARGYLRTVQRERGFVPGIFGVLAESEAALRAYGEMARLLRLSTFTPTERQLVMLVTNRANRSRYCMAGHSAIAEALGVPVAVIDALRDDRPLPDARLEALRRFTLAVLRSRGDVDGDEWQCFLATGYTPGQALEVVACVAHKVLSNYVSRMAGLEADPGHEPWHWPAN